jgi:hypothetical protein
MKIVLISCVKGKRKVRSKAKDLYKGPLFKNSLCVAYKLQPDKIYILSAKHHLLDLEKEIDPYNLTLKDFSNNEKETWGKEVIKQLEEVADLKNDEFIILAGRDYINPIADKILNLYNFLGDRNYGKRTSYLKSICKDE